MPTAPMAIDTAPLDALPPATAPDIAPKPHRAMRALLVLVALCQSVATLSIWPVFFSDLSALPGQGGWITAAVIAFSPLASVAALACALTRRLRLSVIAIAVVSLMDWSRALPKIIDRGLDFLFIMPSVTDFVQWYVFPALCLAGLVMAALHVRLGIATVLATAPSVLNGLFWVAFVIVVSIYGF